MSKILLTGGSGFIGENLIEIFNKEDSTIELVNIDIKPNNSNFQCQWIKCDIQDFSELKYHIEKNKPDYIINLAAKTDCGPDNKLEDYKVNIEGAKNVFDSANEISGLKGLIHISTQFVNQTDFPLEDYLNYKPHTIYGKSKVLSEKILINGAYKFNWVILRPTNVWGKWHPRYSKEFWKVLNSGKYIHPHRPGVIRSYGYVGNVCHQILFFLNNVALKKISGDIFYVGDQPLELYNWVNEFSLKLRGKKVRTVPPIMVYFIAFVGSLLKKLNISFPITISRYRSMTQSNPAPMEKTIKLVGKPKYSLTDGVKITVDWLKREIFD